MIWFKIKTAKILKQKQKEEIINAKKILRLEISKLL